MSASEVSAFEPQSAAELELDPPEFVVVRRGVDRRQVEEWGKKLTSVIQQERRRADEAERALYRTQLEAKGTPSFSHLGAHAAGIIQEASQSAEKMLLDAADRVQEAIDGAKAQAAEITEAAEGQAREIKGAARRDAERLRAEGARAAEEVREAAEAFRSQTEQEAHSLLEEARAATEAQVQQAERERLAVEAETRRLQALRARTHEQLGRMYGHLESVLDEVRRGIGAHGTEEEAEPDPVEPATSDPAAATPAAGAASQQPGARPGSRSRPPR